MLSSISAGKSSSTSNWLHRLRSSKGFPAGDDFDLEQFLNRNNPNLPSSSDCKATDRTSSTTDIDPKSNSNFGRRDERRCNQISEDSNSNGEKELFNIAASVLSELFNMGDANDLPMIHGKKCSRKQPNPRFVVLSTSANNAGDRGSGGDVRGDATLLLSIGSDNGRSVTKEIKHQEEAPDAEETEEDKSPPDLSSFSKTEVTVIDTSFPTWKFDKLLFRKKNVWKARDKNCRAMNLFKKKRKKSFGGEKKPKVSSESMVHATCRAASMKTSNKGGHHQVEKRVEAASKATPDIFGQIPDKSITKRPEKEGSSVILIKNIPWSKKK